MPEEAAVNQYIDTIDPSDGSVLQRYPFNTAADMDEALE
jgi:hypothetical protein